MRESRRSKGRERGRARRSLRRGGRQSGRRRALVFGLKTGVGLLLVTAGLLWAWAGLRQASRLPYFAITHVTVRGNSEVSTADILERVGLRPGTSILEPDLGELRRRVLANPWIREARVIRRLPLGLEVAVWERTPEVLLIADRSYLAGGDGVVLVEAPASAGPDLPRIVLPAGRFAAGDRPPGEVVPRALALWRALAASPLLHGERLQEIRPERNGTFAVRTAGGILVRVREEDAGRQILRLEAALRHAGTGLQAYEAVDLRFGDRVVLRTGAQKGG
ncbi:MAG: FtsQ-type POTRA domain-containing protein [candidate division NC10 bacterium]|nr:FtsQ-type POTRA domain-containing protein [candidate division NC10 bacterium]